MAAPKVELYLVRTGRRQIETHPISMQHIAPTNVMTPDERQEVRREALMRALAIVQRYQDENWRRLRVNDICADLKRLIKQEAER
jgi:hypothetical protein